MKVLVIGKAKTGTTVVARTIQESLFPADLIMEPNTPAELFGRWRPKRPNCVAKIIYENWNTIPRSRSALVHGELIGFDKVVYTLRDPRDEFISRLIYFVLPWSRQNPRDDEKLARWIQVIKKKEQDPSSISMLELVAERDTIFGGKFINHFHSVLSYMSFVGHRPENSFMQRYESFIEHQYDDIQRYLGFALREERSGSGAHYTRRTAAFNNWKGFLLQEDIDHIKANFGEIIEKFGYSDWNLQPSQRLPSEHYSGYIEKLLSNKQKRKLVDWALDPFRPHSVR